MKISWTKKKSNMEVLNMIDEPWHIIKMMELRKTQHVYYKFNGREDKWEKRKRSAEGNKSGEYEDVLFIIYIIFRKL